MSYLHQGKSYGGSNPIRTSDLSTRVKAGITPKLCPACNAKPKKQSKHGTYLNYCSSCSNEKAMINRRNQRERNQAVSSNTVVSSDN